MSVDWPNFAAKLAAPLIAAVLMGVFRERLREWWRVLVTSWRLYSALASIRMQRFTRCRQDYSKRAETSSITSYFGSAKRSLRVVGITLGTAKAFDDLDKTLRYLLEQHEPVQIHISLLDYRNHGLMEGFARNLGKTPDALASEIRSTAEHLQQFKNRLSQLAQDNFIISIHDTIPFASAIMIDIENADGRIQLESKPFQAPFNSSIGFELKKGGVHPLFGTLSDSFCKLLKAAHRL
jgi:hypothetical protein